MVVNRNLLDASIKKASVLKSQVSQRLKDLSHSGNEKDIEFYSLIDETLDSLIKLNTALR